MSRRRKILMVALPLTWPIAKMRPATIRHWHLRHSKNRHATSLAAQADWGLRLRLTADVNWVSLADPASLVPSPPGPPNILLKTIKHGYSTAQDREPVRIGCTAQHYRADDQSKSLPRMCGASLQFCPIPLTEGTVQMPHSKAPDIGTTSLGCL